jgi:hypothetical protein
MDAARRYKESEHSLHDDPRSARKVDEELV